MGYETATEAEERAKALNAAPPKGWVPGSFRMKSQPTLHTRKRTYTVIGDRDLSTK